MGLRLATGISLDDFLVRTGVALPDAVDPNILAACVEEGYLPLTDTSPHRHRGGPQTAGCIAARFGPIV